MGSTLPEPVLNTEIEAVSIGDMWHFINKKNEKFGYGGQWTVITTKPVVSKSIEMINISLLITCYLNEYNGYEVFQNLFYLSLIEHSPCFYTKCIFSKKQIK